MLFKWPKKERGLSAAAGKVTEQWRLCYTGCRSGSYTRETARGLSAASKGFKNTLHRTRKILHESTRSTTMEKRCKGQGQQEKTSASGRPMRELKVKQAAVESLIALSRSVGKNVIFKPSKKGKEPNLLAFDSKEVWPKNHKLSRNNSRALNARLQKWPRILIKMESKYAAHPGLTAAKSFDAGLKSSLQNQCINIALHVAAKEEMFESMQMAEESQPSAYGGWLRFQVKKERAKEFVELMVQGVFEFEIDEDAYDKGDIFLEIDMANRAQRVRTDWNTLCTALGLATTFPPPFGCSLLLLFINVHSQARWKPF